MSKSDEDLFELERVIKLPLPVKHMTPRVWCDHWVKERLVYLTSGFRGGTMPLFMPFDPIKEAAEENVELPKISLCVWRPNVEMTWKQAWISFPGEKKPVPWYCLGDLCARSEDTKVRHLPTDGSSTLLFMGGPGNPALSGASFNHVRMHFDYSGRHSVWWLDQEDEPADGMLPPSTRFLTLED